MVDKLHEQAKLGSGQAHDPAPCPDFVHSPIAGSIPEPKRWLSRYTLGLPSEH